MQGSSPRTSLPRACSIALARDSAIFSRNLPD